MKSKNKSSLFVLRMRDHFAPIFKKAQQSFSMIEWKYIPSEQNSLMGLA